jgi:hypothetical protein
LLAVYLTTLAVNQKEDSMSSYGGKARRKETIRKT